MKTIIYNMNNGKPIRITDEDVCITQLNDNEDFMPLSMWEEINGEVKL